MRDDTLKQLVCGLENIIPSFVALPHIHKYGFVSLVNLTSYFINFAFGVLFLNLIECDFYQVFFLPCRHWRLNLPIWRMVFQSLWDFNTSSLDDMVVISEAYGALWLSTKLCVPFSLTMMVWGWVYCYYTIQTKVARQELVVSWSLNGLG